MTWAEVRRRQCQLGCKTQIICHSLRNQHLHKLQDLYITGRKKSIRSPPRLFWDSRRLICALLLPNRGKNMAEQAVVATEFSCPDCNVKHEIPWFVSGLLTVHAAGKRGSSGTSLTLEFRILETPRYAAKKNWLACCHTRRESKAASLSETGSDVKVLDLPMQEKLLRMSAEALADRKVRTAHCTDLAPRICLSSRAHRDCYLPHLKIFSCVIKATDSTWQWTQ